MAKVVSFVMLLWPFLLIITIGIYLQRKIGIKAMSYLRLGLGLWTLYLMGQMYMSGDYEGIMDSSLKTYKTLLDSPDDDQDEAEEVGEEDELEEKSEVKSPKTVPAKKRNKAKRKSRKKSKRKAPRQRNR